jgi:hypothetical protein
MQYSIYGLSIRTDCPIPGAPECLDETDPAVDVTLSVLPTDLRSAHQLVFPSATPDEQRTPHLLVRRSAQNGDLWLTYDDGTEFVVNETGSRISMSWPATLTLDDAATYLLGPILGFLLRLRGTLCLHASAVEVDGKGVVLLGPPGAGKSTLAATFAETGFAVLSDDVAPVTRAGDAWLVQPGYPRLRLWPDSVQALYGAGDFLPRITPTWDKRHLDLTEAPYQFSDRPVQLAGIYLLDERTAEVGAPVIEAMKPREALVALIANTSANYLIAGKLRADEFIQLEQLASTLSIRRVRPNDDVRQTPRLCRAIVHDLLRA